VQLVHLIHGRISDDLTAAGRFKSGARGEQSSDRKTESGEQEIFPVHVGEMSNLAKILGGSSLPINSESPASNP
jgi:hypothetical protein